MSSSFFSTGFRLQGQQPDSVDARASSVSGSPGSAPVTPLPPRPSGIVLTRPGEARLSQLLSEHFRAVWRMVRRLGVPPSAADDATQEVFIIAARKLELIELGRERQFLLGTALRVAANIRRSSQHREYSQQEALVEEIDPKPTAESLLDQKRKRELLDRVLDSMPDDLRTTFVLVELEGMSGPEVAELIHIPVGTVASRLRRAREAFHAAAQRVRAAERSEEGHL